MFAQMISVKIKPGKIEEFKELYQEYINPEIKNQKGYCGFYLLHDKTSDRVLSLTLWETGEDAEKSEEINLYLEQRAGYPFFAGSPVREGLEVALKA